METFKCLNPNCNNQVTFILNRFIYYCSQKCRDEHIKILIDNGIEDEEQIRKEQKRLYELIRPPRNLEEASEKYQIYKKNTENPLKFGDWLYNIGYFPKTYDEKKFLRHYTPEDNEKINKYGTTQPYWIADRERSMYDSYVWSCRKSIEDMTPEEVVRYHRGEKIWRETPLPFDKWREKQ